MRPSLISRLVFFSMALILGGLPDVFAQSCDPEGDWILFTNYDGGNLNIVVDQNIPNLRIGICSYEPVNINLSGPFVSNVTEVRYAGFNSAQNNNNCGFPIATTQISGVNPALAVIETYPPVNVISPPNPDFFNQPNGWNFGVICMYTCDLTTNQGGCNTADQVIDYFQTEWGGSLRGIEVQYGCWLASDAYAVSAVTGNCCGLCAGVLESNTSVAVCANDLPYLWNGLALNGSGTESVSLVAANGCDSLATLNLTVSDPPSVVDVQQSCGPFTWVDGVTYTASTNTPQFNYVGAAAGGCDSLVTLDLTITEPPTADFEWIIPDSGEGVGPLELSDLSTGSPESWSWTLFTSSGVFTATGANPLVYLPDDVNGPVEVVLEVVDANGCADLTSQTQIWSSPTPFALFLPTAITPNNDGINDVFRAEGVGIDPERFRMELFNRWGESVFVSTDPEAVWLGEVRQGDYWVGDGIYSFLVQAAGKNQIEVMTYRGSVTVMR